MFKMNATKAKNEFGLMLEHARKEPVSIERNGRGVAVVISFEEYSRLQELENKYWVDKATKAVAKAFKVDKKSAELLSELLNGSED